MQALPDLPCILWLNLGKFSCNVLEGIYHSCSWTDWRSLTVNTLIAWNILEECTSNQPGTFNKCADQNLGHLAWPRKKTCSWKVLWKNPLSSLTVAGVCHRSKASIKPKQINASSFWTTHCFYSRFCSRYKKQMPGRLMSSHPIVIIDMHSGIPIPEAPTKLWAEVQGEVDRSQRKNDHHYYHHHQQHLKPFNARITTLLHKTHFRPESFCTRNVSHQMPLDHKPFTPEALYTSKPFMMPGASCTKRLYTKGFYIRNAFTFWPKPVTPETFYAKQLWHQKTFTPNAFYAKSPLYQNPLHNKTSHIQLHPVHTDPAQPCDPKDNKADTVKKKMLFQPNHAMLSAIRIYKDIQGHCDPKNTIQKLIQRNLGCKTQEDYAHSWETSCKKLNFQGHRLRLPWKVKRHETFRERTATHASAEHFERFRGMLKTEGCGAPAICQDAFRARLPSKLQLRDV